MAGPLDRTELNAHTRSFTGCATCRSRHVKCDEGRPTCSMCAYLGLPCAGYQKDIFFDSRNPEARIRFRRPLLTVEERERMSEWLVSTAPPKSTLQILSRIDEECENSCPSEQMQLSVGPFGVFKVHQYQNAQGGMPCDSDSLPPVEDSEDISTCSPPQDVVHMMDSFPISTGSSQWSPGFLQSLLRSPDQDPSPTSPDLLDLIMDQGHLDDTPLAAPQEHQLTSFIPDSHCNPLISPISLTSSPSAIRSIPQDAVFLLKHYSSTVISLMTSVRHKKTPWHVLFIPHAKDCLAALALGEDLNHASLCTFSGTLAISAFSLGGVSGSQSWHEQGRTYLRQAQHHAKIMLMNAYDIPKPAKYKSILMAILTMVQVSTFSGNRDQAEEYFLEAEKFIRLKGLKRKKSRKVRLLHHCYVFERMFHESIFIRGANSDQRQNVRLAIESSGLARASIDSLSFRLYKWKNLSQEMLRVRDREEGENDLHLERPGLFSASLYPEIFGIPEPWILLLSLVIRLGTEKDTAEENPGPHALNLKDFISRAKSLEDYIKKLWWPSQDTFAFANNQSSLDRHILKNMLEALRHALAIYFYRRIYDLNASMLQENGSQCFIWPAFIAACEAEDPEVQESFSTWFEVCARRSGLLVFTQTMISIKKIWQEKQGGDGNSASWLDLMKKALPVQQQADSVEFGGFMR